MCIENVSQYHLRGVETSGKALNMKLLKKFRVGPGYFPTVSRNTDVFTS